MSARWLSGSSLCARGWPPSTGGELTLSVRFLAAGCPLLVALLRKNARSPARPGLGAAPTVQAATAVCGAAKTAPASQNTFTCSPRLHFLFLVFATRPGAAEGCPNVYMGGGQPFSRRRSSSRLSVPAGRGAVLTPWGRLHWLVSGRIPGALRHSNAYFYQG